MAEPTNYDKLQDGRLDSLESLVTAEYQPPAGTEYSYPVSNQGITQDQFRNMMRGLGKGTLTQHTADTAQNSYRLVDHGTDSETNQRNTLILRPATTTGQAETVSNGFFHVLTDDIELPFPAVTSPTTYHVTVTYDPRLFKTTPLKVEVYPGPPPTTYGRDHVVLFKVQREPNQLLSQATRTPVNQWLGNIINVWAETQLPDPTHVEYGTLAVVLRGNQPTLYTSRGVHGWVNVLSSEWVNLPGYNQWQPFSTLAPRVRREGNNVHLSGRFNYTGTSSNTLRITTLEPEFRPTREIWVDVPSNPYNFSSTLRIEPGGSMFLQYESSTKINWISLDGIQFPID